MKKQIKSVTNPYAREEMAAEFLLKMILKYGDQITLSDEEKTMIEKVRHITDLQKSKK
jgi:hypothetical protein